MKGKIVAPLAIPPRPEGRPTFICGTESSNFEILRVGKSEDHLPTPQPGVAKMG